MKGVKLRNLVTSRVLHSSTVTGGSPALQNTPLSQVSRMSEVYREFRAKIIEIKVAEINAPLNF